MAASKLEMYVSSLQDKIWTKLQRLHLCFRGSASHWNPRENYATKPEVDKTNMAASKLEMHVSPLPDETSTKFQRLYLCLREPASHWNPQEYYTTEPGVSKFNMAASKLGMHVSPLPDEMSTTFQRLYLCFREPASHWNPREYYATKPWIWIVRMYK